MADGSFMEVGSVPRIAQSGAVLHTFAMEPSRLVVAMVTAFKVADCGSHHL